MDDTVTDKALVAAVGAGDSAALERVYQSHKGAILTVAVHMLGDRETAEDVLHDVFVGFARRARRATLDVPLRAYLVRAAVNRAIDLRARRAMRSGAVPVRSDRTVPAPLQLAVDREVVERVSDAIARIPPAQRDVVTMRLHGDVEFGEIAAMLGTSVNTVKSRYRYGLAAIRRHLQRGSVSDDEIRRRS